jgi:hypothetical protein
VNLVDRGRIANPRPARRPLAAAYLLISAAPALAITSSCEPVPPEQPIAPISLPP